MTPEEIKAAIDEGIAKAEKESTKESQKTLVEILETQKQILAKANAQPVSEDAKEKLLREDKNYQASAFFTAVKKGDKEMIKKIEDLQPKAITAPGTEGTSGDGGILVPTIVDGSIKELIPTYAQSLKVFNVMPMASGNIMTLPALGTRVAGGWYDENAQIVPEKQAFTSLTLTPKKWAGLLPVSNELLQDANPEIGAFLIKTLGIAEGYALDGKTFQAGNTTLTGLFYTSNSFGKVETLDTTDPASLTYANLVNIVLGVDPAYLGNAKWNLSGSVLALIMNIKDLQDRPIFDFNSMTLLGYPVNIIPQAPTSAVLASKVILVFGDLSNSYVGDVAGRRINIFDQGSVTINGSLISMMEYDLSAIRVVKRYAFTPGLVGAYAVAKCASS
jgi:HK97 family phage major capsid protein